MVNENSALAADLSDYPYQANFAQVLDSKIHYVDVGQGEPMVFIHGIPTWSYLWRNVIGQMQNYARCIAPDLIGMGRSGKPEIKYTFEDHIRYFTAFMDSLDLQNVTLVMHGWGSVVGLAYAMANPGKIRAIAMFEAHLKPMEDYSMVTLPVKELASILAQDDGGYQKVMLDNYFVEFVLPNETMRKLSSNEMQHYREPFQEVSSRQPLWQYLQELPLGESQNSVSQLIDQYDQFLEQSQIPKLLLYDIPGFNTRISTVQWAKQKFPNITIEEIGEGMHFAMESAPEAFSQALLNWYRKI